MSAVVPQSALNFQNLLRTSLQEFVDASIVLGDPLQNLASMVKTAFDKTHAVVAFGLYHTQAEVSPDHAVMVEYYDAVKAVVEFRESPKDSQFANHFSTVREAIVALGWINVKPAPAQFIRDMREAGEYYANRVLSNNKGNQDHANWVNKWNQLLVHLQKYVKDYFLTGFTWGAYMPGAGGDDGSLPPPPPPPPPAGPGGDSAGGFSDANRQALLRELNQGTNITRNLRPHQRDSKPSEKPALHAGKVAQVFKAPVSPPKFSLEGRKWVVEYQKKNLGMTINNDDMSQSLAMYHCEDSFLKVENKINSVVIDTCKKTNIVLKDVISSVELIRCDGLKIQCDGTVPLINLDNCESVQIFLSPKSRGVEIVSSKSSSSNICLLEPDGDYKELPMPEQIKTVLSGNKLLSKVIEKY